MTGNIVNGNTKVKSLLYVLLSNSIVMISGIMMAFLIPIVTSIEDYATIRLFLLYLNYASIITLGFVEGISIYYGKYEYNALPRESFSYYFKFFIVFELVFVVILFFSTFKTSLFNYDILLALFIFLNFFILNIANFCNYINMITKRFNIFFWSNLLSKFILIILILLAVWMEIQNYLYFILIITLSNLVLMIFNLIRVKDLLFKKVGSSYKYIKDVKKIFIFGFPTMIAFIVGMICYGLGQFVVEGKFSNVEFAHYAFAYSILALINLLISSLGTVLFPYITRFERENLGLLFKNIQTLLVILFSGTLIIYYMIIFIVNLILPDYSNSLIYLSMLFPIILFDSIIRILIINYFKALQLQKKYLIVNFSVLFIFIFLLGLLSLTALTVLNIALVTLVTYFLWMLMGSLYLSKYLGIKIFKNIFYQIIIASTFIIINNYSGLSYLESPLYYGLLYIFITIAFYTKEIHKFIVKRKII